MTPGFAIARRLTAPPGARAYPLRILAASGRTVTLQATGDTVQPGEWGLLLATGGHLRLAGEPRLGDGTATWRVAGEAELPAAGDRASWTGIVAPNPSAAGLRAADHLFDTAAGTVPAWLIDETPGGRPDVWAVHIHGMGSSRAGALRGVAAAHAAGVPSIVPTYRNTVEGPRVGAGRSHLGLVETDDIGDVLERASVSGDERFILFGWSMGAQMALQLAASDRWADRIDRLVLDSPVLDWRAVIAANLRHSRVPARVGRWAEPWLQDVRRARLVGLDRGLDLDAMDWVRRADAVRQPVLIHHGAADWSAPAAVSEAFVAAAPDARLIANAGGHTTGWNTAPAAWHEATAAFLAERSRPTGDRAARPRPRS